MAMGIGKLSESLFDQICFSGLSMHQKRKSIGLLNRGEHEGLLQAGEFGNYEVLCYPGS